MFRRDGRRRRGIAVLWTAVTLLVLLALVGLAMDLSLAVYGKQQLQHAADAAALAGASLVKADQAAARDKAQEVALANKVYGTGVTLDRNDGNAEADGDIVIGYFDRKASTFTPANVSPNAMQVMARRTAESHGAIPLIFGRLAGKASVDAKAEAIAIVHGGTGAGLIVLDPTEPPNRDNECAADFGGNVTINVTDMTTDPPEPGAIQINGSHPEAICANGTVDLEAGQINVTGGAHLGTATFEGELNEGTEPIPDPLADLPAVNVTGMPTVPIPDGNVTVAPGYHAGPVKRTGGMITLESGIHVFDSLSADPRSVALEMTGTAGIRSVEGGGVMLYVRQGGLVLEGTGGARLDPLDAPAGSPDATYNGVVIFQARDNEAESKLAGGNGLDLTGTLYFPNNLVWIRGGGTGYGNQLIAHRVSTFGQGEIRIMYDGRNPAPGHKVFLVR